MVRKGLVLLPQGLKCKMRVYGLLGEKQNLEMLQQGICGL